MAGDGAHGGGDGRSSDHVQSEADRDAEGDAENQSEAREGGHLRERDAHHKTGAAAGAATDPDRERAGTFWALEDRLVDLADRERLGWSRSHDLRPLL